MTSTHDLMKPLALHLPALGFAPLPATPDVVPPRSIWAKQASLPSRQQSNLVTLLDIMPSVRHPGRFTIAATLTLDGRRISPRVAPRTYHGDIATFIDHTLPAYQTLAEMEDFFGRDNPEDPEWTLKMLSVPSSTPTSASPASSTAPSRPTLSASSSSSAVTLPA